MVNARRKGSKNERELAKLMKVWTGYEFTRTPSSGGLRWQKTDNITGDIVCTDPQHRFPFSLEGKSYKEINFEHLLYLEKCDIFKFWAQAKTDAERGQKIPILMMRYNGLPKGFYFVVMSYKDFLFLKGTLSVKHPMFRYNKEFVILNSKILLESNYRAVYKKAKALIKRQWPRKNA